MSLRTQMRYMAPYDIHKALINEYILKRPGDTKLLKRDSSNDKVDFDVLRENHKFLWDDRTPETWEEQFAKKYYDKLFKEYGIGDLSRYKENKIALRWRTEQEVISGKGQFICGEKRCSETDELRSWEVNFVYTEQGQKKNALVKIRLCSSCSKKLNYHTKKREIKRKKGRLGAKTKSKSFEKEESRRDENNVSSIVSSSGESTKSDDDVNKTSSIKDDFNWESVQSLPEKSREEEMEDYLQDLLL